MANIEIGTCLDIRVVSIPLSFVCSPGKNKWAIESSLFLTVKEDVPVVF